MTAAAAIEARDTGAALALEAETSKWQLEWAITKAARSFPEFTSDEVWGILRELNVHELDHPNALGGAFLHASRAGIIEASGRVKKSTRFSAHRRNIQIWDSLIFPHPTLTPEQA